MKKNPSHIETLLADEAPENFTSLLNQIKALQCVNASNILPFIEAKLADIQRLKKLDTEMNDDDWITLSSDLYQIKDAVLKFIDEVRGMHGGNGPIRAKDIEQPSKTIHKVEASYAENPEQLELKPNVHSFPHSEWMNHSGRRSTMKPDRKKLALKTVITFLKKINEEIDAISSDYQAAKENKLNADITMRQGEVTNLLES